MTDATFDANNAAHSKVDGKFTNKLTNEPKNVNLVRGKAAAKREHVPGRIGGWEVKNYKEHSAGMEGGGYTASIYRDGKRVMTVSNDGNGGSDRFASVDTGANLSGTELLKELEADAVRITEGDERSGADMFVSLLAISADFNRHAKKIGADYTNIAKFNIDQYTWLSDREKEIITSPEKFA